MGENRNTEVWGKGETRMGICLNPGNEAFRQAVNSEIYVDKTGLLAYTNRVLGTERNNICVSRPRRFGKTMAAKMMAAYYDCECDSRELFSRLMIGEHASFEQHLNRYDVLFLNIQLFLTHTRDVYDTINCLQKEAVRELAVKYRDLADTGSYSLPAALTEIYRRTGQGFVIIIDEWDCFFREKKGDGQAQKDYLDFLRVLLKDQPYVKLAYMTGILPIKKYGTHSALNMFDEFSMTNPRQLAEYVGFTDREVEDLCVRYGMDFPEAQRWYDGYCFRRAAHVYNPKSVVDAMWFGEYENYWTRTETYEALKVYIDMDFDGLKSAITEMLGGGRCRINSDRFQNDMTSFRTKEDVLALLIHLGYLAYDIDNREVFIPNLEIEKEFALAIEGKGWAKVAKALSESEKLLDATWRGDAQLVAEMIDEVHMDTTSILSYHNENSLSCVITLAYYSAKNYYTLIREMPAGKGFADIVFLPASVCPDKPAMVVELKWDSSAESAITQIREKRYVKALDCYEGDLILVGISYDRDTKKHQCSIERTVFSRKNRAAL